MKVAVLGFAVACLLVSGSAFASEELAKKNCMVCHQLDKVGLGPSFQDVSKKYAADKDGEAKIMAVVKNGSKGVTGEGKVMAPMANVNEADAKSIAAWVLSLSAAKK
ncbi:c-type cytochrome [Candidatus Electronema sp. JM]|uniref:c-type cytochrome n=1 Tax=Candidatus Electronema sp. JM TaxID=3401571 RepID=UPI003AA84920